MSFNIVCGGCGAPSSPSVGLCPFCKTVMTSVGTGAQAKGLTAMIKSYNEGRLDRALTLGSEIYKRKPEMKENLSYVLTYVKVLIETEGPSSMIRSLLGEAYLLHPESNDLLDFLEIIEGKNLMKLGPQSPGVPKVKNVLRRSPNNVHGHFVLGTYLFWVEKEFSAAIPHLEKCVQLHPTFLRAWACLGALYKAMGNSQLSKKAFEKCAALETQEELRDFFLKQAQAS